MLEIIEYGKGEYEFPALVVLGCFDAIHAGHRELLKKAKLQAKINGLDLGVMMFREGKGGKLVYSFEERCAILEQYNVKFVLAVDFTPEFKAVAPLDFLHEVEDKINVKAYMSGKDFRFGAQAKGKSSTLKNYAEDEENGVWYMPVKDVVADGEKISTTIIKTYLDAGNVVKANELLGSEFSVTGEVVKGEGRGTSVVGFPTVNIVYPEWKHPLKHGVYSVKCMVGDTDYQGIANFGNCPTFGDERVALEVYLEGYSGDLYGQILTIRFVDYIRDIEEFASAEELSGQLKNDLLSVSDELAVTATEPEAVAVSEEVTEEVVEEVVEEPAETVVEDVVEQPVETVSEEIAEEPVEIVVEEVIDTPTEEVVEEVAEVPADTVIEEPAEEVSEEVVEELTEETAVEETTVEETVQPLEEEIPSEAVTEEIKEVSEEVNEDVYDDGFEEIIETTDEEIAVGEQTEQPEEEDVELIGEEQTDVVEQPVEEIAVEQSEETERSEGQYIEEEVAEEVASEESEVNEMPYSEGEESTVTEEPTEEEAQSVEADDENSDNGDEN